VTIEELIDHMVIFGKPSAVLDKLVAFRENVGPFGGLLLAAMDWSGINEKRERYGLRSLAERIMPRFSQHAASTRHPLA
jgi:hypothetical protein